MSASMNVDRFGPITRLAAATRVRIALGLLVIIGSAACFFAVESTFGRVGAGMLFISGCATTALAWADHRRRAGGIRDVR